MGTQERGLLLHNNRTNLMNWRFSMRKMLVVGLMLLFCMALFTALDSESATLVFSKPIDKK
jgi:hypothetical protein